MAADSESRLTVVRFGAFGGANSTFLQRKLSWGETRSLAFTWWRADAVVVRGIDMCFDCEIVAFAQLCSVEHPRILSTLSFSNHDFADLVFDETRGLTKFDQPPRCGVVVWGVS